MIEGSLHMRAAKMRATTNHVQNNLGAGTLDSCALLSRLPHPSSESVGGGMTKAAVGDRVRVEQISGSSANRVMRTGESSPPTFDPSAEMGLREQ